MNTEILGVALQILLLLVISYPLGKHIAKVYKEGNDCMRFMAPIERFIYKLAGINPNEEMDWKAFLKSLLIINVFWFFWGMILLVFYTVVRHHVVPVHHCCNRYGCHGWNYEVDGRQNN